jgi:acyl-CoA synthetase (AMP-forming)/AMP-acid ligase II
VFEQQGRGRVGIDAAALERYAALAAAEERSGDAEALRAQAVVPATLDLGGEPGVVLQAKPEQLAFIQYSSGSTGEPKGALLTHRNLCANIASIIEAAAFSDRDVALSWMPLSHDMGLIGFHLNMLACGASHAIMRTELFARRPLLWLEQASRMRATVLCSPNFGYQHYLKQHELKARGGLDLASVRLVFNGAEPISAELCRRFTQAMARMVSRRTACSRFTAWPRPASPSASRDRARRCRRCISTAPGCASASGCAKPPRPTAH